MRLGYSMWGFLGSGIINTPDGARSYRRPFVDALIASGHEIVFLQGNRDLYEAGLDLRDHYGFHDGFPDLDALFVEWRWPLPDRNTTACGAPGHTCDLHRQDRLIQHYTEVLGVPTVVWDLDRQLPATDPLRVRANVVVCEPALVPTPGATTLPVPVPDTALDDADPARLAAQPRSTPLVYLGNQYDRDSAFDVFFAPAALQFTHRVAGKWPRPQRWPWVTFTGRVAFDEVTTLHHNALATVLLLPDRYTETGHMTSRLFEALLAGCLPLAPTDISRIEAFAPPELQVTDGLEVIERLEWLTGIAGSREHAALIATCVPMLEPFRASEQVEVVNRVLVELTYGPRPTRAGER